MAVAFDPQSGAATGVLGSVSLARNAASSSTIASGAGSADDFAISLSALRSAPSERFRYRPARTSSGSRFSLPTLSICIKVIGQFFTYGTDDQITLWAMLNNVDVNPAAPLPRDVIILSAIVITDSGGS